MQWNKFHCISYNHTFVIWLKTPWIIKEKRRRLQPNNCVQCKMLSCHLRCIQIKTKQEDKNKEGNTFWKGCSRLGIKPNNQRKHWHKNASPSNPTNRSKRWSQETYHRCQYNSPAKLQLLRHKPIPNNQIRPFSQTQILIVLQSCYDKVSTFVNAVISEGP